MHSPTLLLLKGLAASGKTTWAKSFLASHVSYRRVSRDDLRMMTQYIIRSPGDDHKWHMLQVELLAAEHFLSHGYSVLVDDCNLNPETVAHWYVLATRLGVEVAWQDFTDVPLEVCVARDAMREHPCGEAYISLMYERYIAPSLQE